MINLILSKYKMLKFVNEMHFFNMQLNCVKTYLFIIITNSCVYPQGVHIKQEGVHIKQTRASY